MLESPVLASAWPRAAIATLVAIVVACGAPAPPPSPTATTPVGSILSTTTASRTPATSSSPSPTPNAWQTDGEIRRAAFLRRSLGLRTDPAWIRSVASDPRATSVDTMGWFSIPLTDEELAQARAFTADRETVLSRLRDFANTHPESWAGMAVDGPSFVVFLVDPTGRIAGELRAAVRSPIEVRPARWTLRELELLWHRIQQDEWLFDTYHLLSAGVDPSLNAIDIEISTADAGVPAEIADHFAVGDRLSVRIDGTGVAIMPKGSLKGRAVDENGDAVEGLYVDAVPDVAGADTGEIGHSTTADGMFEYQDIPAVGYTIRLLFDDESDAPMETRYTLVGQAHVVIRPHETATVTIVVSSP